VAGRHAGDDGGRPRLTIGLGHTAQVNVPLGSIPVLSDGQYYFCCRDPPIRLGQITTAASSSADDRFRAPFIFAVRNVQRSDSRHPRWSAAPGRGAAATLCHQELRKTLCRRGRVTIDLFCLNDSIDHRRVPRSIPRRSRSMCNPVLPRF